METMLPEPTIAFTIPSYQDATVLSCRLYHPLSLTGSPAAPEWKRHAAVFAHPYAPLGGSADDHVVDVVAGTLLRKGYLVGTFNFRYAPFVMSFSLTTLSALSCVFLCLHLYSWVLVDHFGFTLVGYLRWSLFLRQLLSGMGEGEKALVLLFTPLEFLLFWFSFS